MVCLGTSLPVRRALVLQILFGRDLASQGTLVRSLQIRHHLGAEHGEGIYQIGDHSQHGIALY